MEICLDFDKLFDTSSETGIPFHRECTIHGNHATQFFSAQNRNFDFYTFAFSAPDIHWFSGILADSLCTVFRLLHSASVAKTLNSIGFYKFFATPSAIRLLHSASVTKTFIFYWFYKMF